MTQHITGNVHSVESFGTVDGPGVRFVVFLQGCPLRCRYCHNPDTWRIGGGTPMTAEELLNRYERNKAFYSRGGITVTGGEPLVQIDFVTELFRKSKERGIHTCLDTSGATFRKENPVLTEKFNALCKVTDLVMLDIKHADPKGHRELTGMDNGHILEFAEYLAEQKMPVWIRHVVVPGITDSEEEWRMLGNLLARMPNVRALDVLPYHTMGVAKYRELGIPYTLEGVPALDAGVAKRARNVILEARRDALDRRKS